MNIVLSTLNAKYIHTNLAIRYLKAAARPEFECELAEYTIKDPAFNIVSDLFQKKPRPEAAHLLLPLYPVDHCVYHRSLSSDRLLRFHRCQRRLHPG